MGLFGNMIRTMGQARAYFFLIRMCERHNRRIIGDRILSLNAAELRELVAAYKLEVEPDASSDEIKCDLTALLIAGTQPYDLQALEAHRAAVKAAAEAAEAASVAAKAGVCAE